MKQYKLVNAKNSKDTRTLTCANILEAIEEFNNFKARHPNTQWALVLGTLDKFPSLVK